MLQIKPGIRQIATVSAVIALIVFIAILFITGVPSSEILPAVLKSSVALTITGGFWVLYDRLLWRFEAFRLFGWLSPMPNLNGRWEGTVERDKHDAPHPFVLEVVQTFTSIRYRTFTAHSTGESTSIAITKLEDSNIFGIVASWRTTTKKIGNPKQSETFRGVSHWRLEYLDKPGRRHDQIKVVDDYYTDRKTIGRVELTWVSRKLKNGFNSNTPG